MQRFTSVPGVWRLSEVRPEPIAIVEADGRSWTRRELTQLSNRLSHAFIAAGLQPGDRIAVLLSNRAEFVAVVLAASQVGLTHVLVNSHLSADEAGYVLADSGARLVITDAQDIAPGAARSAGLGEDALVWVDTPPEGGRTLPDLVANQPTTPPRDRCVGRPMLYTSGTSGKPRGVLLPEIPGAPEDRMIPALGGVLRRFGIDPLDHVGTGVHLVTSPMYHAAPLMSLCLAVHLGHRLVIMERWSPEATLRLVSQHRVTWTTVVPTMFMRMLDLPDEVRDAADTSSLRWVLHGAAPCPPEVKRRMFAWLGPVLYEYYSATEVSGTVIGSEEWLAHPGSVGRSPRPDDVQILDPQGRPLTAGEVGLIYLRDNRRFRYHNDEQKTAAAKHEGYVTVGDLGWLDDEGYLYLADRRTDLIISGGVNIYPAEVEAALLTHELVADAAVVGLDDNTWGQRVHAVVQLHSGITGSPEMADRLIAHVGSQLAGFKRPRSVEFRAGLPRTATGKLLRRLLVQQAPLGQAVESGTLHTEENM